MSELKSAGAMFEDQSGNPVWILQDVNDECRITIITEYGEASLFKADLENVIITLNILKPEP